mmetsp:Transcript_70372/g.203996  ORF Transcript_70372/g.203996 Transcript_70372/m.203996 type:complete len:116 (+) Transcript_70372:271-618(+)
MCCKSLGEIPRIGGDCWRCDEVLAPQAVAEAGVAAAAANAAIDLLICVGCVGMRGVTAACPGLPEGTSYAMSKSMLERDAVNSNPSAVSEARVEEDQNGVVCAGESLGSVRFGCA